MSCNKNYYEDVDFRSVYNLSQEKTKKLWVMLGGGDNCRSCNDMITALREKGIFKKYSKDYIFYKCNIIDTANIFLHYIFLTERIPNGYIFDEKGKLVFASYSGETIDRIEESLKYCLKGNEFHCGQNQLNIFASDKLLKLHNYTLKAYLDNSDNTALKYIDSSINLCPYFFNIYFKSKILAQIGQKEKSIEMEKSALLYYKPGFQALLYKDLYGPLNVKYIKTNLSHKTPKIKFEKEFFNLGEIKINTASKIKIEFQNIGTKPLLIYAVKTDCGCVTTKYSKKPIMPNEKSEIELTYNDRKKGEFRRTVDIITNSENSFCTLLLKGEVK